MALKLDLTQTPFSRKGSRFSFSFPTWLPKAAKQLHLLSHHGGGLLRRDLFRIEVLNGKRKVPFDVDATPVRLRLRVKDAGEVTFIIATDEMVRFRGEGLSLRLVMPTGWAVVAHPSPGGRWTANARYNLHRYMLEAPEGRLEGDAPWKGTECERIAFTFSPGASGAFEGAIDEFTSTWPAPRRVPFGTCMREIESEWTDWLRVQREVPKTLAKTAEHAAYVNWSAVVSPGGHLKRPAMLMSKRVMDRVWSWDHCFNALALAAKQPDVAWDQFMVMFDAQDEFGALPDMIDDLSMQFNFSKPPVHGWALARMRRSNPALATNPRLTEAFEVLARWTNWWTSARTWPQMTLPTYLHGNDSGWDNSSIFDGGTPIVSPDLAAFLVLQMEELADLADALGRRGEADTWRTRAKGMLAALIDTLWRDDRFVALRLPAQEVVDTQSLILCLPIVLGKRLPKEMQRALVKRIDTFVTKHGLATEHPESPYYESDGYWRGPIWAPSTLLIVDGLLQAGEDVLAKRIAQAFCRMCAKSGFAENFDALTGEALRDSAYTWTSSVFLILAHEVLRK